LLQPAWDLGAPRRTGRGLPPILLDGRPVVLVARNTVAAAGQAVNAVNVITAPGGRIAVLAIVSDGFPEPPEASYRFCLLEPRIGGLVRVPFVPLLRVTDRPAGVRLPGQARAALAEIRARTTAPIPNAQPESPLTTARVNN